MSLENAEYSGIVSDCCESLDVMCKTALEVCTGNHNQDDKRVRSLDRHPFPTKNLDGSCWTTNPFDRTFPLDSEGNGDYRDCNSGVALRP